MNVHDILKGKRENSVVAFFICIKSTADIWERKQNLWWLFQLVWSLLLTDSRTKIMCHHQCNVWKIHCRYSSFDVEWRHNVFTVNLICSPFHHQYTCHANHFRSHDYSMSFTNMRIQDEFCSRYIDNRTFGLVEIL